MITHELRVPSQHNNAEQKYQEFGYYTESKFINYQLETERDHTYYVGRGNTGEKLTLTHNLITNRISADLWDTHEDVFGEEQFPTFVYNSENVCDQNHAPQYTGRIYGQSLSFAGWHFTEEFFGDLLWTNEMVLEYGTYITHHENQYPFENHLVEIRVEDMEQDVTIQGNSSVTFNILSGFTLTNNSYSQSRPTTSPTSYSAQNLYRDNIVFHPIYTQIKIVPARLDRNDGDEIIAYVYAGGNTAAAYQTIGTEDVYGTMHSTGNKEDSERIVFEKRTGTRRYTNPANPSQDGNISGVIKVADKHYYDYWRNQTTTDSSRGLEEKNGSLVPYNFSGTYTRDLNFYINETLDDVHIRINYPIAAPLIDDDGGTELSVKTSESELPDKEMPKQFFTAEDLEIIREENLSLEEILKLLSK